MTVLVAEDLSKRFRGRPVVKGVSFAVGTSEVVGLLGPNGAGKTTCFHMLVGLVPADGGRILLDSQDVTRLPIHRRARLGLGYLPQEPSIFTRMTVLDNVRAVLELVPDGAGDGKSRRHRAEALLHDLHIGHLADQPAVALSGGERRRLEIARALATGPRLMLLDEPFAGVDPISVLDIRRIVRHLTERGIGVLITDHNVRETLAICDRACILSDGEVIAEGDAAAIVADERVRAVYLGEEFQL